jgi:hypothetical protein
MPRFINASKVNGVLGTKGTVGAVWVGKRFDVVAVPCDIEFATAAAASCAGPVDVDVRTPRSWIHYQIQLKIVLNLDVQLTSLCDSLTTIAGTLLFSTLFD